MRGGEATLSFKVILLGDSNIGKTCFLRQFIDGQFPASTHPTICVDFASKAYQVDEFKVRLNVFDTAGQEKHRALTKAYFKGADAVLFMYSMESRKSFENVAHWIKYFEEEAEGRDEVRVLVGTKKDLLTDNDTSPTLPNHTLPSQNPPSGRTRAEIIDKIAGIVESLRLQVLDLREGQPQHQHRVRVALPQPHLQLHPAQEERQPDPVILVGADPEARPRPPAA